VSKYHSEYFPIPRAVGKKKSREWERGREAKKRERDTVGRRRIRERQGERGRESAPVFIEFAKNIFASRILPRAPSTLFSLPCPPSPPSAVLLPCPPFLEATFSISRVIRSGRKIERERGKGRKSISPLGEDKTI